MQASSKKPVLAVLGPTASGKTPLALSIARRFNCEIVNCDSRQIYQEMSIGTARPSDDEMLELPHHLFNLISPEQSFSAADFSKAATLIIRDIWQRKRIPLLTGGTGFYYSAVTEGLGPAGHDATMAEELRLELVKHGLEYMKNKLSQLDPKALNAIDSNNPRRVLRAIEIIRTSNKPLAENRQVSPLPEAIFFPIIVTRPRAILHHDIEKRIDQMIGLGLETEVRKLIDKYGREATGLSSIGYNEWFAYFDGKIDFRQMRELVIIHTRQYAKRQETWFRKRPGGPVSDLNDNKKNEEIFSQIAGFLKQFAL